MSYPSSVKYTLSEKEANPRDSTTNLSKEELIEGDKIGTHVAKEEFTLYRNIRCICPKYFKILNDMFGPNDIPAVAELQIPVGATMVRNGYKFVINRINFNTMRYEQDGEIQSNVWESVKINHAIVKRRLNNYDRDEELSDDCACYDNKSHYAYLTVTDRENPINFQKGSTIHSYRNDMKEYSFLRSDELSGGFDKYSFAGYD